MSITKAERLEQLKEEEQFHKVIDKYFDAGWKSFVKGIRAENDISNLRMFKILQKIKGPEFVADLIKFMKSTGHQHAYLELTKKPKGMLLKDSRFKTIPELMIEKYTSGSYREGKVYIRINENRWVKFTF